MIYIKIIILSLFTPILLFAQDVPFIHEWAITDYYGAAYNDQAIVCYGDHGIITYTNDRGKSWKQINIFNNNTINKIIAVNHEFYCITHNEIGNSLNGSEWQRLFLNEDSSYVSLANIENDIYVLTKKSILKFNIEDPKPLLITSLDSQNVYSQFTSDKENLYFKSDSTLFIYNIQKHNLKEIAISKKIFSLSSSPGMKNEVYIKTHNNVLYLIYGYFNQFGSFIGSLSKTKDAGDKWNYKYNIIRSPSITIHDTSLYFMDVLSYPKYYEVVGLNNFKLINDSDICKKDIFVCINEIIEINEDTLIAVGNNKTILISNNKGKNWEIISNIKSFCYPSYGNENLSEHFTSNSYLIPDIVRGKLYLTKNNGATYLPENNMEPQLRNIINIFIEKNGIGSVRFNNNGYKDRYNQRLGRIISNN